jgi:hypothetical protein
LVSRRERQCVISSNILEKSKFAANSEPSFLLQHD